MAEQNSENIVYPYDSYGLFLGLISYPFNKDGKEIYKDLEIFFEEHKSRLKEYDPSGESKEFNDYLYKPAGYRMFGSQGLAVLSLVDDYAFPIRYFDKDHIQALVEEKKKEEKKEDPKNSSMYYENFHSIVVMGVNEWEKEIGNNGGESDGEEIVSSGKSLVNMANDTFLSSGRTSKYPFIGIIRLKINSQEFLLGRDKGIATIRKIRKQIDNLEEKAKNGKTNLNLYHITVECFDNDEMTVLAFSDNLLCLFNFLGEIRSMKNADLEGFGLNPERHVFGSTLISFGYDVAVDLNNVKDKLEGFSMKCMIETKCGHRDSLYAYFKDKCELYTDDEKNEIGKYLVKNMTGGCNIIATMPLERIPKLESCCLTDVAFKNDIRRMKVVLEDLNLEQGRILNVPGDKHAEAGNNGHNELSEEKSLMEMKNLMKKIGISKMVRDRMLSLYELYDNAHEDLLQQIYLEELKDTLKNFCAELKEMENDCSIKEIEKTLNSEIESMENAIYDRLHMQKHIQMPLEYSGGIQQYLTSFDYAYKKIQGFFNNRPTYVTITGAKRGASVAHLFKLNINEILYPELFITLVWKEIANFALLSNDCPKGDNGFDWSKTLLEKEDKDLIHVWRNLTQNDEGYEIILNAIRLSENVLEQDLTSQIIIELLEEKENGHELLKYFLKDYMVLHFAFNDDFDMMWHFYFKALLQTTVCYESLNNMKRDQFIHMLLRLFLVAQVSGKESKVKEFANTPFDSLVSVLWFEYFNRTWKIARDIFGVLQRFDFSKMCKLQVAFIYGRMKASQYPESDMPHPTYGKDMNAHEEKSNDKVINKENAFRVRDSNAIKLVIENNGEIIEADGFKGDFICSLFYAYMKLIYEIDCKGENKPKLIKSLPRNKTGEIIELLKKDEDIKKDEDRLEFYDNAIAFLTDPTGGFFIPSAIDRKKYFLYRTLLYRSLWNYRYTDHENTNKN